MLRRQMLRPFRKPLIVMTPKSLLRDKKASSPREGFVRGGFQVLIDEPASFDAAKAKRVLLCGGQVYYKLVEAREQKKMQETVAIVRLEQLYPFPRAAIAEMIHRYQHVKQWVWVQEEPRNQGAWQYIQARIPGNLNLSYAGRRPSASPAVGYLETHRKQLQELLEEAFDLEFR
jgi:2-oxoglutarate dehydrogenase E1 component